MKKWIFCGLMAIIAIVAFNTLAVHRHAYAALQGSDDINVAAYYRYGVKVNSITYDLWDIGPEASHAFTLGRFFQFAEELKDREFKEVRLAYRGKTKFILDGDDFQEIGRSFEYQNPVYIVRTLPEKLKTPNGRKAFSRWSGGLLGVVGAQMDDVNQMARNWYLDDMFSS